MKAMVLAAGRGTRLLPLTEQFREGADKLLLIARRKRTAMTGWLADASAPTTMMQPASS